MMSELKLPTPRQRAGMKASATGTTIWTCTGLERSPRPTLMNQGRGTRYIAPNLCRMYHLRMVMCASGSPTLTAGPLRSASPGAKIKFRASSRLEVPFAPLAIWRALLRGKKHSDAQWCLIH